MISDAPSWRDVLLMTPQAWARPLDLQLQTYLYEIYHANIWNRTMHSITMAPITFGQMLLLPYYWRAVWCVGLVAYYFLALRDEFGAALALAFLVFAMNWAAASLEAISANLNSFRLGIYICVACTVAQTLSHGLEARMPPNANGHRHKWVPNDEYYRGAPLRDVARNFIIGCVLEFMASPKLLAVQALSHTRRLNSCTGQIEWWDELQSVARTSESDLYAPIDFYPGSFRDDDNQADDAADVKLIHPHTGNDGGHKTKSVVWCGDDLINFLLALVLLPLVILVQFAFGLFAYTKPPASDAQQHSKEDLTTPPWVPDILDDVEEMRARILRSEPFITRSIAGLIENELSLPQSFVAGDSDEKLEGPGVVKIDHETRDFPQLYGFVRNVFGTWRSALRHRPLWFGGNYISSTVHIDITPSYNLYCLKQGRKRVVLFPLGSTAQEKDLVLGSDQLFVPGTHDQAKFDSWLALQPRGSYCDFELNAGEALFFNTTALHYFKNLEPDCVAYSIRLPTLHMSSRLRKAIFCAPFSLRWQVTKHSVVNLRGRNNSRRAKEA